MFSETAAFDEVKVLEDNMNYLLTTLDLIALDIKRADEADERVQEECCPGEPFIVFRTETTTPNS